MQIKVINLRKYNPFRYKNTIIVALIVLSSLIFSFFAKIYRDDREYVEVISDEKIIIVDAGHGGEDAGATGINGVHEKDLNLQMALTLGEMLTGKGYTVVYTRTEDKMLYREDENIKGIRKISDLKNRGLIAKEYPNAIFLSIHMNSFGDKKYSGLQVYYSTSNDSSMILANSIQTSVKKELQPSNNRKIKEGKGIYLLENISNTAVLIECGFLSNSDEAEKLSQKEYQKILSFSIVCGIIEYMNTNT